MQDSELQQTFRPDFDALRLWLECLQLPEQSEEDLLVILRAIRVCRFQTEVNLFLPPYARRDQH